MTAKTKDPRRGWKILGKAVAVVAGYSAVAYVVDVPIRRNRAAWAALSYARARGKPLLNVGAGTAGSALFGQTLYGEVNVDLEGRKDVPHGTPGVVTHANAEELPFEDGSMGAVVASHILEHVHDPGKAMSEWLRVVGGDRAALFVVTPSWWAPHTWLHPQHYYYFPDARGGVTDGRIVRLRDVPKNGQRSLALAGFHRALGLKPVLKEAAVEAAAISSENRAKQQGRIRRQNLGKQAFVLASIATAQAARK